MNQFASVVSAMTYSIVRERFPEKSDVQNRVTRFVVDQHGRMSSHFRVPLLILTLGFDFAAIFAHGARFHQLPHSSRWRYVAAWRSSRIGICRDLIRFYESLAVFGCYSMEYPQPRPVIRVSEPELRANLARGV